MTLRPPLRLGAILLLMLVTLALIIATALAQDPSPAQMIAGVLLCLALAPLLLLAGAVTVAPQVMQMQITPTHLERMILGRCERIALADIDAIASLDARTHRWITPLLAALTGGGSDLRLIVIVAGSTRWHVQPRWFGLDHDALKSQLDRALLAACAA